jgi:hypothetical protein
MEFLGRVVNRGRMNRLDLDVMPLKPDLNPDVWSLARRVL